jgi:Kinase/pyrophosphorylase
LKDALRQLQHKYDIDVCLPHNCLHHLFTFPFESPVTRTTKNQQQQQQYGGIWGDFFECIYRGEPPFSSTTANNLELFTLSELKVMLDDDVSNCCTGNTSTATNPQQQRQRQQPFFTDDTRHALRLFFQRQHDLRARRRLLKGYSSADLQRYGLQHTTTEQQQKSHPDATATGDGTTNNSSNRRFVLSRTESTPDFIDQKQEAVDYTMRTDDGMAPHLLYKADVILLGVSRAGKTPLSIYMAQTLGLKVANIPLVLELPPPSQLLDRGRVDPRRVFCLTLQTEFLERFRKNRFSATGGRPSSTTTTTTTLKRNEGSIRDSFTMDRGEVGGGRYPPVSGNSSTAGAGSRTSIGSFRGLYGKDKKKVVYSQTDYIERDLDHARSLAREYGYTELDGTSVCDDRSERGIFVFICRFSPHRFWCWSSD